MHSVTKDLNPFLEIKHEGESAPLCDNDDLFQELRVLTLENLETLNLKKISLKINKLLESPIKNDSLFSKAFNIACPVKESSIRRWMDDLGFVCCPVKKSYVINIHEREDVNFDIFNTILKLKSEKFIVNGE